MFKLRIEWNIILLWIDIQHKLKNINHDETLSEWIYHEIHVTLLFLLTLYSFLFIITEIEFDVHYLHEEIKIKWNIL
jgi:hypothetical protein